mgnify:CR=1 FL=1
MKSKDEKIIFCEVKKIHNPKPRRIYKINNCFKGSSKYPFGGRKLPIYNYENKKKGNEFNHKNKQKKYNFDEISLEEIENDFMAIKAKSEILKVENELLEILFKPSKKLESNNISNNVNSSQNNMKKEEKKLYKYS